MFDSNYGGEFLIPDSVCKINVVQRVIDNIECFV